MSAQNAIQPQLNAFNNENHSHEIAAHRLFEQQAALTPNATALVFDAQRLSYQELNQRANQVAHHLLALGVQPETLVGVYMARCLEMIISVLGILKAGGAYAPLDASYPQHRVQTIIEDSKMAFLITKTSQQKSHLSFPQTICFDADWLLFAKCSTNNPIYTYAPHQLAYVIYTSGSTGQPKGVLLEHIGLSNLVNTQKRTFSLQATDRILQFAALNFDASVWEIFMALTSGACLHLIHDEDMLGQNLLEKIREQRITIITLPPSILATFTVAPLPSLHTIIVAGEACSAELVARWRSGRRFFNAYGPTEATVCATIYECITDRKPVLGRPIDHVKTYILDKQLQHVPIGEPGELHIDSVGLARGYLNLAQTTVEKFIPNPFDHAPNSRLYKTGDLACFCADGNIEFLGRIDHQVKIRGVRVELGDIQAVLSRHDAVRQTVVMARETSPGNQRIIAYAVIKSNITVTTAQLLDFLRIKLPKTLIPAAIVQMDFLPLTANGKIDRCALPTPTFQHADPQIDYIAPKTEIEQKIASIFQSVLNVKPIGRSHNLLHFGADSLLITRALMLLRDMFQIYIPLQSVFNTPTIAELAVHREVPKQNDTPMLQPIVSEAPIPLSFAQQQVWLHCQMAPDTPVYNEPFTLRFAGSINTSACAKSLNDILHRHTALRTTFLYQQGQATQSIQPYHPIELPLVDLRHTPEDKRETVALQHATTVAQQPFDLTQAPLFRPLLLQLRDDDWRLHLTFHHLIMDGVSLYQVFLPEFMQRYTANDQDAPTILPPLPIQYTDFALWQQQTLSTSTFSTHRAYWKKQLADLTPLQLPTDRIRPTERSFAGACQHLTLPYTLLNNLKQLSHDAGVTLFVTLLSGYKILLHRYCQQQDIAVGAITGGRHHAKLQPLIGHFANTVVLRTQVVDTLTCQQLLRRVRDTAVSAFAHQEYPFEHVVADLHPERKPGANPLFQAVFDLDPPLPPMAPGWEARPFEIELPIAKFDLSMALDERKNSLLGRIEYNTALFDADTIARMAEHYRVLLTAICDQPDRPIAQINLLSEEEQQQFRAWNNTQHDFPSACVQELFEQHARQTPDAIAVRCEHTTLSYAQLNQKANQVAHHLMHLGVHDNALVGVCMARSIDMIISILGVLKAGGAYVPMDPNYPPERITFMLQDSRVSVLLTQQHLCAKITTDAHLICLDSDWPLFAHARSTNPIDRSHNQDLAYVIYTSGSTGTPKGVEIQHKSLVNLTTWHQHAYHITANDKATQIAAPAFDACVWEIWPYLTAGASLFFPPDAIRSATTPLLDWMADSGITICFLPTPLAQTLVQKDFPDHLALKYVLTGGDKLHAITGKTRPFQCINHYGPTESTVVTSCYTIAPEDHTQPPIGQPIYNTQVYVLDANLQSVPIGIPGELHIGGASLARGYLHRNDLTDEKFIHCQLNHMSLPQRMYKTGDLVRYRKDGNLEFLGRIDNQVSIRGVRIELGEIEVQLAAHAAIQENVVIAREESPGDQRLIAYLVAASDERPDNDQLRHFVQSKLPMHMIPAAFVYLDTLPLTHHGKIDRKALPKPKYTNTNGCFIAPNNPLERQIAAVLCDSLKVSKVGLTDNFFDLGANSLLLMQISETLTQTLKQSVSIVNLMAYPSIQTLTDFLSQGDAATQHSTAPTPTKRQASQTDIAIIGLSGRFPGASTTEEFWHNLRDGVESITFFTDETLLASGVDAAVLHDPNYIKAKGALDHVDQFDAEFFGFSALEAQITDPQHRLLLECAWEALEHAGYNTTDGAQLIGVFGGVGSMHTYLQHNLQQHSTLRNVSAHQIAIGNAADFAATRIAYKLNLSGPCATVQTACSTSLTAVVMGVQSLLHRQCDMALAGGAAISLPVQAGYTHQTGMIFSPDGHCRAFDEQAQGTLSGNGVGIVLMKRLDDALAAGDTIHAVIKGAAMNNDGAAKLGFSAPSVSQQCEVIAQALAAADVSAESIDYVETHGTGTQLGDSIEIAALTQAYRRHTLAKGYCAIGSLKTNIGHMDAASGIGGLIKTVLSLQHQQIPPSLHCQNPNPKLDLPNSPFYVNTQLSPWRRKATPRRAAVSSFGIGGSNVHVILEEAPQHQQTTTVPQRPDQLLLLSAKTQAALDAAQQQLAAHLQQHSQLSLADVAYTYQVGRGHFQYGRMLVCATLAEAREALLTNDPQRCLSHAFDLSSKPEVIFMFPGQGAQYANMGAQLYATEAAFRSQIDHCAKLLQPQLDLDIRTVLFAQDHTVLAQTAITQPALFVIEYALAQLWRALGVQPKAMIGHSIGEYVAACLAGVMTLPEALTLVATRGRLMQALPTGAMLAAPLSETAIQPFLGADLALAAVNAPEQCVLSGTFQAIATCQQQLAEIGVTGTQLHTSHAFHCNMMMPMQDAFLQAVRTITLKTPHIPYISNVTGTWIQASDATDPQYWVKHLCQTVRFTDGLTTLLQRAHPLLLEVGPGHTLRALCKRHPAIKPEHPVLTSLPAAKDTQAESALLLHTLGQLHLAGLRIDWATFHAQEQRQRLPLPTYPFQRKRYWIEPPRTTATASDHLSTFLQTVAAAGHHLAAETLTNVHRNTLATKTVYLDHLCVAYMAQALQNLGVFMHGGETYTLDVLVTRCNIQAQFRQLFARWLAVLVEHGYLSTSAESFSYTHFLDRGTFQALITTSKAQWADEPHAFERVRRCGEQLARCMTGASPIVPLLSQENSLDTLGGADVVQASPQMRFCNNIIRQLMQRLVALTGAQRLNILEIGGGSGYAASVILPELATDRTRYTFSDISRLLQALAQKKFSAYPFVEYQLLNIDQAPRTQGCVAHSYDLVIAVNALHATQNIDTSLAHVQELLAPGGLLLLWETTQPLLTFDITEAFLMPQLTDGARNQGNPFLSVEQWRAALLRNGFAHTEVFAETVPMDQHILLAQADTPNIAYAFSTPMETVDTATNNPVDKKPDMADWFYQPVWKATERCPTDAAQMDCVLVFGDDSPVCSALIARLQQHAHTVIGINIGDTFAQLRTDQYTLNPQQADDYQALLHTLDRPPTHIAHFWSVTAHRTAPHLHEPPHQHAGFDSLFLLAQALGAANLSQPLQLQVLCDHLHALSAQESLMPEKATLLGACKVIQQEYPAIICRSLDAPAQAWLQDMRLLDAVVAELRTASNATHIAYRDNQRFVQHYAPTPLPEANTPLLRNNGVYWITGGLSGIGLALASDLAQTSHARLILTARSAFPPPHQWAQWCTEHAANDKISRAIVALQAIQAHGVEPLIMQADVAEPAQMQAVVDQALQRFGCIHGVIHSAGVTGGGAIGRQTLAAIHQSWVPKVTGTRVLAQVCQPLPLDFVVLCSSLSSVLGGYGHIDYCAANAYLDAFARAKSSQSDTRWISIGWDIWPQVGMGVAVAKRHGEYAQQGLSRAQGVAVFRRSLACAAPHILVSTWDLQTRIDKDIFAEVEPTKPAPQHTRPQLPSEFVAPRTPLEHTLAEHWRNFLGIEHIGVQDDFFALGGDSLLAVQLIGKLRSILKRDISPHSLLHYPTIASLAASLAPDTPGNTSARSLLVEIQAGNSNNPPLFLIHPIGGSVYFYRDLAQHLPSEQPVYGIQAQGLDGKSQALTDIQAMATLYIDLIRAQQAHGPYHLGGSSLGGLIAFEIAQQLQTLGEQTALLAMIDSPGPGHMPQSIPKTDVEILCYLLNIGAADANSQTLAALEPEAQLRYFIDAQQQAGLLVAPNTEELKRFLQLFRVSSQAIWDYHPSVYSGRIVFFRASEADQYNAETPERAWVDLAAHGLELIHVPGNHITMNQSPHVQVIAERLQRALNSTIGG